MVIIGFFIGSMAGTLAMALFAGRSYSKGWKDGFKQAMAESIKIVEDMIVGRKENE